MEIGWAKVDTSAINFCDCAVTWFPTSGRPETIGPWPDRHPVERPCSMALDPNRWTLKTQEAFNAAVELARNSSHPEVTPAHLLVALLGQQDGVVLPILTKVGVSPLALRTKAEDALAKLPKAYGGESRLS